MNKYIKGGFLSGQRTYIISSLGILSAIGTYLVGDIDVFEMLQAVFTLGGIYFLRRAADKKESENQTKGD